MHLFHEISLISMDKKGSPNEMQALNSRGAFPPGWVNFKGKKSWGLRQERSELCERIYIYIYIIHIYIYMYIYIYTHRYAPPPTHTHIYIGMPTHTHTHIYIYIFNFLTCREVSCVRENTHTHTHTHTQVYAPPHMYIHTHCSAGISLLSEADDTGETLWDLSEAAEAWVSRCVLN